MFLALGIQQAMRMRHIAIWPRPAMQHFSTLSHKRYDFRKKVTEHKMCALISSTTLSEKFLILRRTGRDIIENVYWSLCKVPVIIVIF